MTELIERSIRTAGDLICGGRLDESEAICRQILRVDENNSDAMCLLSFCLQRLGRGEEALGFMESAAEIAGEDTKLLNSLGLSCMHAREIRKALEHFSKASELDPADEDAPFNMGSCMMMLGRPEHALHLFREAHDRSGSHRSMVGMACAKADMLDLEGSKDLLEAVLEADPKNHGAKANLASVLHLSGNWDEAWKFYAARLEHNDNLKNYLKKIGLPLWRGDDPKGENILVFSEQGLGDALNFWRFVPELGKRFPESKIRLLAPIPLRPMLAGQGLELAEGPEGFDLCCSFMDLPGLLKMGREEVESSFARIRTEGTCNMDMFGEFLKVGVCWAGNPAHPNDMRRSCRLTEFKKIQMEGVKLFSLQKDPRPRVWPCSPEPVDLCEGSEGMRLVDMSPYMDSWEHTAAIVSSLDLVISVDTSVMHLAAAMGKETWGLLPYVPDWRWGLGSDRTCWYPTLRLFRQDCSRSWGPVFSAVRDALERKLGGRKD